MIRVRFTFGDRVGGNRTSQRGVSGVMCRVPGV